MFKLKNRTKQILSKTYAAYFAVVKVLNFRRSCRLNLLFKSGLVRVTPWSKLHYI